MGEVREALRPPLPARLRSEHWLVLDVIVAVAYACLLAGWVLPTVRHTQHPPGLAHLPAWLDWVAVMLATVPVAARRRFPLAALGVAAAGVVLAGIGGLREQPYPALAYVLYQVAVTRPRRDAAAALALAEASVLSAFAAGTAPAALSPFGSATALPSMLFTVLAQAAAWLIGRTVRQQRAYTRGLAAQSAQRAQAEVDAARAAAAGQRLQIARDLHDVVAHSVSLMTVQAGAARMLADTKPEETRQLLAAIEATGRDCLHETRRALGILREDDGTAAAGQTPDAAALSPVPGLGELPGLAARSAEAGVTVTIRTAGTTRDLPATLNVTAYRIIQEALTNVIRHTAADRCQVTLGYGARALSIQVTNPPIGPRIPVPRPPGVGHGLAGMRERVTLHGGQLTAGPAPGGGYTLTATIPLPDASR